MAQNNRRRPQQNRRPTPPPPPPTNYQEEPSKLVLWGIGSVAGVMIVAMGLANYFSVEGDYGTLLLTMQVSLSFVLVAVAILVGRALSPAPESYDESQDYVNDEPATLADIPYSQMTPAQQRAFRANMSGEIPDPTRTFDTWPETPQRPYGNPATRRDGDV